MDFAEYENYRNHAAPTSEPTIHVSEVPGEDRTLVYGYSRTYDMGEESTHTVHVYKHEGLLHVLFYRRGSAEPVSYTSGESVPARLCVPQKRAYPERTDAAFAHLLRAKGEPLCFTTFDQSRQQAHAFHGPRVEELPLTAQHLNA